MIELDKYDSFVFLSKESENQIDYYNFKKNKLFEEIPFNVGLEIYNPNGEHTENDKLKEKELRRAEKKAINSLEQIAKCIRSDFPRNGDKSINQNLANKSVNIFKECIFSTKKAYIHVRGASSCFIPTFVANTISVIGGPCLFGSKGVKLHMEDGEPCYLLTPKDRLKLLTKKVKSLEIDQSIAFYEYESIFRQTSVVSALIKDVHQAIPVNVIVDVPNIHYYFHLMDPYINGNIDNITLLNWFQVVDYRSNVICSMYTKSIIKQDLTKKIHIGKTDVFRPIVSYMISLITANKKPNLSKIIDILINEGDPTWGKLFSVKKPTTYDELCFFGYMAAELQSASTADRDGHLAIVVENYPEWKILQETKKIMFGLSKMSNSSRFNIIGIYPIERFIIKNKMPRSFALYSFGSSESFVSDNGDVIDGYNLLNYIYY